MKYKVLLGIGLVALGIGAVIGSYLVGYTSGNTTGFELGRVISYEKGYVSGYDNGREFVVTHLAQYVKVPKAVKYDEVVAFLKEDKTSNNEFTDEFNCISFANRLKAGANQAGIKCAIVSMDFTNVITGKDIGHAINCFETTDKGIVYFDPQTDGQRYGIYVGGTYVLQGITYKITKVDVIW